MKQPQRLILSPSGRSRMRSISSPRAARLWSSRTAFRRLSTPMRFWCSTRGPSLSAERMPGSLPRTGFMRLSGGARTRSGRRRRRCAVRQSKRGAGSALRSRQARPRRLRRKTGLLSKKRALSRLRFEPGKTGTSLVPGFDATLATGTPSAKTHSAQRISHGNHRINPQAAHRHSSRGLHLCRGLRPRDTHPRLADRRLVLDWRDGDRLVRLFLPRPRPVHAARRESRDLTGRWARELGWLFHPARRARIWAWAAAAGFDCHVNRAPVAGRVTKVAYRPGVFLNADLDKASESNERNGLVIENGYGRFGVVQIAGLIARRIVCFVRQGEALGAGDRFGLIRFGSRVDVYMPGTVRLLVTIGSRAIAGETVLAELRSKAPARGFKSG